jgi:elongation factor Ts
MAEITAAAVKALRERTDMPMMKCKQALVKADGDEDKAVEFLKQEAGKILDKRKGNATSEGRIFIATTDDGSEAAMVEVCCESAPVGSGEHLGSLGGLLVKQLLEGPGAATADELLDQDAPDGSGQTLRAIYDNLLATIREKITIDRIVRLEGPIGGYVHHDGKTGALLQATGEDKTAAVMRDVAMHIAALKPAVTDIDGLDPAAVQAERDRLTADAKATGKPDNIVEKIVEGQMKKFYDEQGVLVYQAFAKDDSKSVSQALADAGLKAKAFTCWVLGN